MFVSRSEASSALSWDDSTFFNSIARTGLLKSKIFEEPSVTTAIDTSDLVFISISGQKYHVALKYIKIARARLSSALRNDSLIRLGSLELETWNCI